MTIEFEITQENIERGMLGDCSHCPVALALRRKFPEGKIRVRPFGTNIGPKIYKNHSLLTAFIYAFDDGLKVQPGTHTLEELP